MRRILPFLGAIALATAALALGNSDEARAKTALDSTYGFERTWNAGTRLVRVDLGFKLVEKDEGAGYLLFDYTSPESGKKPVPGSMEFVRARDTGAVKVIVQIPQMPGYHEQVMLDALSKKLRSEYGEAPKTPPAPSVPKDAGPDADTP